MAAFRAIFGRLKTNGACLNSVCRVTSLRSSGLRVVGPSLRSVAITVWYFGVTLVLSSFIEEY